MPMKFYDRKRRHISEDWKIKIIIFKNDFLMGTRDFLIRCKKKWTFKDNHGES